MSAIFDITQNTLGPGLGPGNARTDGVPGELVTVTIQDSTVQEVQVSLLWTPPDDEVAFYNLAVNPSNIKEWTFTPDANAINASGSYLIHVVTDASNPARRDEALLVLGILTPNSALLIPALNEPGNPLASLTQPDAPGAANNVPFLGPGRNVAGSPIADIDFAAWWKAVSDLILTVDGFAGGAGEVNTGVDVGTGTTLVDGANVGVQIPIRSVAGINDIGVALNSQTVEVDGLLLLDLTADRHVVGPDFLTLEYDEDPTIQLHDNSYGAEIDKRWSLQARALDDPPRLIIGAAATDGSLLDADNAGLILDRNQGTANVAFATLVGDTVVLQSGQLTGTGTVLIQPDGTVSDEYPLLTMTSNGTFGASVEWHVGDRTPVGNVTGNPGDMYIRSEDGATSALYQHRGAVADNTSWVELGAGGGGDLQAAYDVSGAVTLDVTTANPLAFDSTVPHSIGLGLFSIQRNVTGAEFTVLIAPDSLDDSTVAGTPMVLLSGSGSNQQTGGTGQEGQPAGDFILGNLLPGGFGSAASGAGQAAGNGGGAGELNLAMSNGGAGGNGSGSDAAGTGGAGGRFAFDGESGGAGGNATASVPGATGGGSASFEVTLQSGGTGGEGTATQAAGNGGAGVPLQFHASVGGAAGGANGGVGGDGGAGASMTYEAGGGGSASGSGTDGTGGNHDFFGGPSTLGRGAVRIRTATPFQFFGPGNSTSTELVHTADPAASVQLRMPVVTPTANQRLSVTEGGTTNQMAWVDPNPIGQAVTAVIVGTNEDLAIGGTGPWDTGTFFRVTSVANSVIGGLDSQSSGPERVRHIVNANAPGSGITVTLLDEGGGGDATSDIIIEGGNLVLQPGGVATVWEDPTSSRWRVM